MGCCFFGVFFLNALTSGRAHGTMVFLVPTGASHGVYTILSVRRCIKRIPCC